MRSSVYFLTDFLFRERKSFSCLHFGHDEVPKTTIPPRRRWLKDWPDAIVWESVPTDVVSLWSLVSHTLSAESIHVVYSDVSSVAAESIVRVLAIVEVSKLVTQRGNEGEIVGRWGLVREVMGRRAFRDSYIASSGYHIMKSFKTESLTDRNLSAVLDSIA